MCTRISTCRIAGIQIDWPSNITTPPPAVPPAASRIRWARATLSGAGVLLGWIATAGDLVRGGQLVPVIEDGARGMPDGYLMTVREEKAAVEMVRAWLVEAARGR